MVAASNQESLKEKFTLIEPWMAEIVSQIKKDLRQEHLAQDRVFFNKYFPGKVLNKLTVEELKNAYVEAIQNEEKGEQIAEFIFHRWLLKNTDIYHFFDKELSLIAEDYTQLTDISREVSLSLKNKASTEFGPEKTYLFCLLNGVVFDAETFKELRQEALNTQEQAKNQQEEQKAQADMQARVQQFEMQISRLTDRYENRLAGLERKYDRDVTALKKQIAQLQKQLQAKTC